MVIARLEAAHVREPHVHYQHVRYRAREDAYFFLYRLLVIEDALAGILSFTVVNADGLLFHLRQRQGNALGRPLS